MMPSIQIVTDSGARFSNPRLVRHFPVTILPNIIEIGGRRYQEGIDLDTETAFELMSREGRPPTVIPPSENDYAELYARLSHFCDAVISVHPSRELSESWRNGRLAAQQVSSDCEIAVVDSQSLCAGQGMLIRVAARAAQELDTTEEVIQAVRQAVNRIYSVYCVGDVGFLSAKGIMKPSHAILSAHLDIMPFVSLEDGQIIVIEKIRNRGDVIERLVEFLVEFTELEDAVVLQDQKQISEETRIMQDRLALEFPGQHFPFTMYSATMASFLGAKATGVAVLEKESDDLDDDF
ncbi:MAG: DegV family EDD domain-containing protein [Chloroflexi bacterium]|nr:DegV family EDD domain-containing protein [Chloroflexota bacterium]